MVQTFGWTFCQAVFTLATYVAITQTIANLPPLKLRALVAGLLARSQYPEGLATGHLGTGFSWFPYV
jgi:hypothetical protein